MKNLCDDVAKNGDLQRALEVIPSDRSWIHDVNSRPEREREVCSFWDFVLSMVSVVGTLENVPEESSNKIDFGDAFIIGLKKLFLTAIFLFTRKECRKQKVKGTSSRSLQDLFNDREDRMYTNCLELSPREAPYLHWATWLEVYITQKIFNIEFEACAAFSAAAHDVARH